MTALSRKRKIIPGVRVKVQKSGRIPENPGESWKIWEGWQLCQCIGDPLKSLIS